MLSLLILFILIGSVFVGIRRGFILQLFHLTSFFIAIIVAFVFYRDVADYLRLWVPYPQFSSGNGTISMLITAFHLEAVFYAGISFILLFFATKIILHMIGSMLDFISYLPLLRTVNSWLGGALGFLEAYLLLFIAVTAAALFPIDFIQDAIEKSFVARMMVENTPFLSSWLQDIWMTNPTL